MLRIISQRRTTAFGNWLMRCSLVFVSLFVTLLPRAAIRADAPGGPAVENGLNEPVADGGEVAGDGVALFPEKGVTNPAGWTVREYANVRQLAPEGVKWRVDDEGVLHGPGATADGAGSWLLSEKQYGDFVLDFEFKLPEQGNSGVGLRVPLRGSPATDGLEAQMVDGRYYGERKVGPVELTGALYKLVPPRVQAYKPDEWNHYRITCRGPVVRLELNGQAVLDIDLDRQTRKPERGKPPKDRPRRGRIGFQDISRGGHVQIRNATIAVPDARAAGQNPEKPPKSAAGKE
jgi:hypothetical protein